MSQEEADIKKNKIKIDKQKVTLFGPYWQLLGAIGIAS